MSTAHLTPAPGKALTSSDTPAADAPATGSTVAPHDTGRRARLAKAVRNAGIMIDTAVRVVILGRDGVR